MEEHLDLTVLSASDLKRSWLSGDQTVAVVWIEPSEKKTTGVTSSVGVGAQWHERLTLPLNNADASAQRGKKLTIEIRSRGALSDNLLGTAYVPLAELATDLQKGTISTQTYQLVLPSGKWHGSVSFLARFVKPQSSGSSIPTMPSAPPATLQGYEPGSQFNTFYPPVSYSSVENIYEKPSSANSANSIPHASPYPPKLHAPQNCVASEDMYHNIGPYSSSGMACDRPQVYPPVNTSYPLHRPLVSCTPCSTDEGMAPRPHFSSTAYPPPCSMYPHPFPPDVYPPRFSYPPALHHVETSYPPPSLNPYPTHSSPLYPPSHPPQCTPAYYCNPYPAY